MNGLIELLTYYCVIPSLPSPLYNNDSLFVLPMCLVGLTQKFLYGMVEEGGYGTDSCLVCLDGMCLQYTCDVCETWGPKQHLSHLP
jgi:hypothetical protein